MTTVNWFGGNTISINDTDITYVQYRKAFLRVNTKLVIIYLDYFI